MNMAAEFKYTITVEKAEQTEDGLFIEGAASGLGVDSKGHEMDPAAIARFAEQVRMRAEAGDPVPYLDSHKQGLLTELGHVVRAEVDPDWNLKVRVKLDEENPASTLLYARIKRGKKFGMSVKGTATKWARRVDDAGRSVLRFFDVALTEVSNTTQPIWTPSFGTVIAKAVIDEADDAESVIDGGDSPEMPDTGTEELQPVVAEDAAPAAEDTKPEADAAPEAEDTTASAESEAVDEETGEVEVENAGARHSKSTRAKFLAMYKEMGDFLRSEGILEDEEPIEVKKAEDETPADDDKTADSADTTDKPADAETSEETDDASGAEADAPVKTEREQELERQLAEMTAQRDEALAKAKSPQMVVTPEGTKPAVDAATIREEIAKLPAGQARLAAAFEFAERAKARR